MKSGVPHRVPDPVRDAFDVSASTVQEHDVEVASWAERGAAVSSDCDERVPAGLALGRVVEEFSEKCVCCRAQKSWQIARVERSAQDRAAEFRSAILEGRCKWGRARRGLVN